MGFKPQTPQLQGFPAGRNLELIQTRLEKWFQFIDSLNSYIGMNSVKATIKKKIYLSIDLERKLKVCNVDMVLTLIRSQWPEEKESLAQGRLNPLTAGLKSAEAHSRSALRAQLHHKSVSKMAAQWLT